jgi:sporulation protein YlmC with PRC-barrel domain
VLRKGARVETREGTHVGDIDEVLVDADTRRASHFVVARGMLFKSRKLIPAEWVTHVDEDVVRLAINDHALERLHDYEPA